MSDRTNLIHCYDKSLRKSYVHNIMDIGQESFFYEGPECGQQFEKLLGKIEEGVSGAIREIIRNSA
jgi:hypothetical protein